MRHEVVGIDLDRREVVARDLDDGGGEVREGFDQLVYAAGAVPGDARTGPHVDAGGVFGVQTLDDGAAIHAWLDARPAPRRAVVVGGGYIGVEMAEAMVNRGLDGHPGGAGARSRCPPWTRTWARWSREAIVRHGHRRAHRAPRSTGLETRTAGSARWSPTAGTLPADIVVLGLGVRPNTALAARRRPAARGRPAASAPTCGCGCAGRSTACGRPATACETVHRVTGQPVHVPLGTHANKQGRVAGHQHRRRVRDVPGRDRHRGDQGVRAGGGPHRPARARGRRRPATRS